MKMIILEEMYTLYDYIIMSVWMYTMCILFENPLIFNINMRFVYIFIEKMISLYKFVCIVLLYK